MREDVPRFVKPMLASDGPAPTGADWAFEVKWDGARAQVRWDGRTLSMRSRHGRSCCDEFPEIQALAEALTGREVILDAELVCLGHDGKPDFHALRGRLGARGPRALEAARHRSPATLMIFGALHVDGRAVRDLPYLERREILAELCLGDGTAWRTPRHFLGRDEGEGLIVATVEQGLEGVVAKRLSAAYSEGRRGSAWVKLKHRRTEWFVVTGWRERRGALPEFLLAPQREAGLRPAGSASLGLDAERRATLVAALADHELPSRGRRTSVRWVAPVVESWAEVHGPLDGRVRDAMLRDVRWPRT